MKFKQILIKEILIKEILIEQILIKEILIKQILLKHIPASGIPTNAKNALKAERFSSKNFSFSCFTAFDLTFEMQILFNGSTSDSIPRERVRENKKLKLKFY